MKSLVCRSVTSIALILLSLLAITKFNLFANVVPNDASQFPEQQRILVTSAQKMSYIFYEIYESSDCTGVVTRVEGYVTSKCIPLFNEISGQPEGSIMGTCGTEPSVTRYASANCDPTSIVTDGAILKSTCLSMNGNLYGKSYNTECSSGPDLERKIKHHGVYELAVLGGPTAIPTKRPVAVGLPTAMSTKVPSLPIPAPVPAPIGLPSSALTTKPTGPTNKLTSPISPTNKPTSSPTSLIANIDHQQANLIAHIDHQQANLITSRTSARTTFFPPPPVSLQLKPTGSPTTGYSYMFPGMGSFQFSGMGSFQFSGSYAPPSPPPTSAPTPPVQIPFLASTTLSLTVEQFQTPNVTNAFKKSVMQASPSIVSVTIASVTAASLVRESLRVFGVVAAGTTVAFSGVVQSTGSGSNAGALLAASTTALQTGLGPALTKNTGLAVTAEVAPLGTVSPTKSPTTPAKAPNPSPTTPTKAPTTSPTSSPTTSPTTPTKAPTTSPITLKPIASLSASPTTAPSAKAAGGSSSGGASVAVIAGAVGGGGGGLLVIILVVAYFSCVKKENKVVVVRTYASAPPLQIQAQPPVSRVASRLEGLADDVPCGVDV